MLMLLPVEVITLLSVPPRSGSKGKRARTSPMGSSKGQTSGSGSEWSCERGHLLVQPGFWIRGGKQKPWCLEFWKRPAEFGAGLQGKVPWNNLSIMREDTVEWIKSNGAPWRIIVCSTCQSAIVSRALPPPKKKI